MQDRRLFIKRSIARELGVAPSTISKEIRRNGAPGANYDANVAQQAMVARRRKASSDPRLYTIESISF